MRKNRITVAAIAFFFVALLGLTWLAYHPGLGGTFLFDDFANLPSLGAFGPVDNEKTFWRYLTSGSADPTGRPLALLSFLIDANDWPASPYPFKHTSVLLHMLNGALLCWLLLKLGYALGKSERQSTFAAMLGTSFWLLHPLFVSTTLYVVQRETILPATFILIGLLGYIGSHRLAAQGSRAGIGLAAFSIGACTLLAVLSKANGALLPMLAWLVDSIILTRWEPVSHPRTRRGFLIMRRIVLIAPSVLLVIFLAGTAYVGGASDLPATRSWTLGERLLTETRILVDYLRQLWLPHPYTTGLFNDAFPVSHGLFSPPSTLLCLLIVIALPGYAWTRRVLHPAFALGILFFFAGHLLESTVVPLELYFEHRNYVPALLLFWPLALWLCEPQAESTGSIGKSTMHLAKLRTALAIVLPLGLACMTFLRASVWGNANDQASLWAAKNPDSPRAQAYAAQIEIAQGQVAAATARLERALIKNPDELQLVLNLIGARCKTGTLNSALLDQAASALQKAPNTGRLGYDWFERALAAAKDASCPGLNLDALDRLLVAAAQNTRTQAIPGRLQDRLHLQGRVALARGNGERALELFNAAFDADKRPGAALEQAAILASARCPELAQRHLDHFAQAWQPPAGPGWSMPSFHTWLLWKEGYWSNEVVHMRKLLAEDLAVRESASKIVPSSSKNHN
jgi:tetratricopeptide (TPR) repeat protein